MPSTTCARERVPRVPINKCYWCAPHAVQVLCIFLSLTFLLTGLCKIIPHVHVETYHFLDAAFRNEITPVWQAKVFDQLGVKLHPVAFKFLIGTIEAFCAIVLWAGNNTRKVASLCLTATMACACVTHYWLDQDFGFPLTLMCCCVFVFGFCFLHSPQLEPSSPPRVKAKST